MKKFYAHTSKDLDDETSWHLLADHLKCTGDLASDFAKYFGLDIELLAKQAGILHDLGKYSCEFQQRLRGGARVTHSTHGAKEAIERYGKLGYLIAYAIAGHHTGLANGTGYDGGRTSLSQRLKDESLPELNSVWQKEITLASVNQFQKILKSVKDKSLFSVCF